MSRNLGFFAAAQVLATADGVATFVRNCSYPGRFVRV